MFTQCCGFYEYKINFFLTHIYFVQQDVVTQKNITKMSVWLIVVNLSHDM